MRCLYPLLLLLSLLPESAPAQRVLPGQNLERATPREMAEQVLERRDYQVALPGQDESFARELESESGRRGTSGGEGSSVRDSPVRKPKTLPRRYRRGNSDSSGGISFSGGSTLLIFFIVISVIILLFIIYSSIKSRDHQVSIVGSEGAGKKESAGSKWTRGPLEEAADFARRGMYAEANRVLLGGGFSGLHSAHAVAVDPCFTSREILASAQIAENERQALDKLVGAVERSLFAGRHVGRDEYSLCVESYEALMASSGVEG